jgi:predicted metal-dependent hydrolase
VVAAEVRSLAQRSSQAAKDIKNLIENSSGQVQEGVELVNQAGEALSEIVDAIRKVSEIVTDIATASEEQATGIGQVNIALNQMDEVTQQNSALVEENASAAKALEEQSAAEVKQLIQASNAEVAEGVQTIEGSRASLAQAVEGIRDVAERLREVARSSDAQSAGLQEITHAVASLEEITQRNAQMAEGSVQTADLLRTRAASLSDGVKLMHLRQGCADEAKELAKRAAELVDRAGPDEAIRQFHDPEGAFRDRDLYIAVADREGYLRAFGPDPSKAGKLRVDAFPQVDQKSIAAASWRVIETSGGGWVEFLAPHPVTKRMVPKISYVAPALGGRWAVQCSVNRGDGLVGAAAA